MTISQLWDQYVHYTRDLTDHARKLGFAGAAICWAFKTDKFTFPALIYWALLFFIFYFLADILHSCLAALSVRRFAEQQEARLWKELKTIEGDVEKPRSVDRPASYCFIAKVILLVAAFIFIICEVTRRLVAY